MKSINKSPNEIEQMLEDAWLGISVNENLLYNPLEYIPQEFQDEPHMYLLWLMSRPEYFSLLCSEIMNINIIPDQALVLQELWNRKFPMLICTRGWGKCERDSYIETKTGFIKIDNLVGEHATPMHKIYTKNVYLRGEDKDFHKVEYMWSNGFMETRKIVTEAGFEKTGTPEHPLRVVRNGSIEWVELKDIRVGDYIPIVRNDNWFEETNNLSSDLAYLLGCLVGDGGYTVRGRISLTTADKELLQEVNRIAKSSFDKEFVKASKKSKIDFNLYSTEIWDRLFQEYGFNSSDCAKKDFPSIILSAPKASVASFISGLFDTDGSVDSNCLRIEFCSKSRDLVKTLQFILTKFGIISRRRKRFNKKYGKYYHYLFIYGEDAKKFHEKIGFRLKRKRDRLTRLVTSKKSNTNKDIIPRELTKNFVHDSFFSNKKNATYSSLKNLNIQNDKLDTLLENNFYYDKVKSISSGKDVTYDVHIPGHHTFISDGFISHNTFILALYCLIRMMLIPGRKIVVCGAGFRQSRLIWEYMVTIWKNAPIFRDLCGGENSKKVGPRREIDMCRFELNNGSVLFALPIGDGQKIRGLRAHDIVADEFATVVREVFETVIAGFGVVTANPIDNVKQRAKELLAERLNIELEIDKENDNLVKDNQIVLSGTAYYEFNHFCDYWKRWRQIIHSKGNPDKLKYVFGGNEIPENFNWRDYSVIRIPFEMVPKGFMDEQMVARSKATVHAGIYEMEYGAVFSKDSTGFFKRSVIESCVPSINNEIKIGDEVISFTPMLIGDRRKKYVFGIDPASESDNFAIVVLEVNPTHRRIVYVWTIRRKEFKELVEDGIVKENDFYTYCVYKIRELCKKFPCERIMLDFGGGGITILEALHDNSRLRDGEVPFWEVIEPDHPKDSDGKEGLHIIELVNFGKYEWTAEANHGMRKDFEDKLLLFPYFDSLSLGLSELEDNAAIRTYDTMEECYHEIEELKNELSYIIMTTTPNGNRDRWDTPEIKLAGGKKGRQRKDRYSALLMANMGARQLPYTTWHSLSTTEGGFAASTNKTTGEGYVGPDWFIKQMRDVY